MSERKATFGQSTTRKGERRVVVENSAPGSVGRPENKEGREGGGYCSTSGREKRSRKSSQPGQCCAERELVVVVELCCYGRRRRQRLLSLSTGVSFHSSPPRSLLSCSPPLSRIRLLYTIRTLVSKRYFTTKKVQKVNAAIGEAEKVFLRKSFIFFAEVRSCLLCVSPSVHFDGRGLLLKLQPPSLYALLSMCWLQVGAGEGGREEEEEEGSCFNIFFPRLFYSHRLYVHYTYCGTCCSSSGLLFRLSLFRRPGNVHLRPLPLSSSAVTQGLDPYPKEKEKC